ncbi:MAG: HNH endonuclease signature motif containing protein [Pseudomonadota bacterium]
MSSLQVRVQSLLDAVPDGTKHYYALTILLSEIGQPQFCCFSGWVGYTDDNPRREIRKASLVWPDRMLAAWKRMDEPGMVITNPDDFALFFAHGGHAVVEKQLAEAVVPEWLAPFDAVHEGEWGYVHPKVLPQSAMQRAPTPKLRMSIIKRDAFKCRICGRSPKDYGDLELHVHHVRPWAAGGVTEERNLITLCHTCHNGLDPHYEHTLFKFIPSKESSERAVAYRRRLTEYQKAAVRETNGSDT